MSRREKGKQDNSSLGGAKMESSGIGLLGVYCVSYDTKREMLPSSALPNALGGTDGKTQSHRLKNRR